MKRLLLLVAALALLFPLTAAASAPDGPWLARRLAGETTGDNVLTHLRALQRIADRNGGQRASATPGYAASVRYLTDRLTAAGYRVRTQQVPYQGYRIDAEQGTEISPRTRRIRTLVMNRSPSTPRGGITAPVVVAPVKADGTTGCSAADYAGLPVRGSIVLTARGSCGYTAAQKVIASLGGRAMLLYLPSPRPRNIWRLHVFTPADFTIPSASVSQSQAEQLIADAASDEVRLHLDLRGHQVAETTVNLFAETRGGDGGETVLAGAHLDSVLEAPGINDNGTSAAALLETARRLAPYQDHVRNKVRFAWWGAEELLNIGSEYYVGHLSAEQRAAIAMNLNFELIASPNYARFVFDGATPSPPGSAAITAAFARYFTGAGIPFKTVPAANIGSDHESFAAAGIPVGGMDLGTLGLKTPEEAAVFGGRAGQMYDPCYHQSCDTVSNLSRRALDENVPAIAWIIGHFATDVSGVRARHGGA